MKDNSNKKRFLIKKDEAKGTSQSESQNFDLQANKRFDISKFFNGIFESTGRDKCRSDSVQQGTCDNKTVKEIQQHLNPAINCMNDLEKGMNINSFNQINLSKKSVSSNSSNGDINSIHSNNSIRKSPGKMSINGKVEKNKRAGYKSLKLPSKELKSQPKMKKNFSYFRLDSLFNFNIHTPENFNFENISLNGVNISHFLPSTSKQNDNENKKTFVSNFPLSNEKDTATYSTNYQFDTKDSSSLKDIKESSKNSSSNLSPLVFDAYDYKGPLNSKVTKQLLIECPLCVEKYPIDKLAELYNCGHKFCLFCLKEYFKIEITEGRINLGCPQCSEPVHPTDVCSILSYDAPLIHKYETFTLRRFLVLEPDARWCPAPDCGFAVIASGCASCPMLKCERPGCNTYFCYHCKNEWHPNLTCDAAKSLRFRQSLPLQSSSQLLGEGLNSITSDTNIKVCPRCQAYIMKMDDGSCNHMTCAICGAEFCWLCMKEISDLHYLSPSGCTFWGKKPWSKKKKILWQLGTLIGAPMGIALIASIAIPAVILGVPIFVARKIYAKYKKSKRLKRNTAMSCGILASLLVSPILALLAVSIGVPILLAYVYGVVPFSLCRNGICGNGSYGTSNNQATDSAIHHRFTINGILAHPSVSQVSPPSSPTPSATRNANHALDVETREARKNLLIGLGIAVPIAHPASPDDKTGAESLGPTGKSGGSTVVLAPSMRASSTQDPKQRRPYSVLGTWIGRFIALTSTTATTSSSSSPPNSTTRNRSSLRDSAEEPVNYFCQPSGSPYPFSKVKGPIDSATYKSPFLMEDSHSYYEDSRSANDTVHCHRNKEPSLLSNFSSSLGVPIASASTTTSDNNLDTGLGTTVGGPLPEYNGDHKRSHTYSVAVSLPFHPTSIPILSYPTNVNNGVGSSASFSNPMSQQYKQQYSPEPAFKIEVIRAEVSHPPSNQIPTPPNDNQKSWSPQNYPEGHHDPSLPMSQVTIPQDPSISDPRIPPNGVGSAKGDHPFYPSHASSVVSSFVTTVTNLAAGHKASCGGIHGKGQGTTNATATNTSLGRGRGSFSAGSEASAGSDKSCALLSLLTTDDGASSVRAMAGSIAMNREMDEASIKALAGSMIGVQSSESSEHKGPYSHNNPEFIISNNLANTGCGVSLNSQNNYTAACSLLAADLSSEGGSILSYISHGFVADRGDHMHNPCTSLEDISTSHVPTDPATNSPGPLVETNQAFSGDTGTKSSAPVNTASSLATSDDKNRTLTGEESIPSPPNTGSDEKVSKHQMSYRSLLLKGKRVTTGKNK